MDCGECNKQEDTGDSLSSDIEFPKPFWVRYFGLQTESFNKRLLEYNVRFVWLCGTIIWVILSIF